MSGKKKRRAFAVAAVLLLLIIGIPLAAAASSFIGRIAPDSVIPDSFDLFARVPNPARLAERILNHEPLHDIMALAELAPLMPALNRARNSGLPESGLFRFAARGRLDGALFSGGRMLAAWDAGILSPLLKILPLFAGKFTAPNLYYVRAGKNSRFEYRAQDGAVFFIAPRRNLLIFSNNSGLFESALAAASASGYGSGARNFVSRDCDIAFLLSQAALTRALGGGNSSPNETADPQLLSAISLLQFQGPVEANLSVLPNRLELRLAGLLGTNNPALRKIIERDSGAAALSASIPGSAQYLTLLSAGSLEELLAGASAIAAGSSVSGDWENAVKKADSSARTILGMDLEELLFSWTGSEFAVYGLEGRPHPVIAIEIKDEEKRKAVFDKAFSSIFLNENARLNLDGNRIPRIQTPGFLNAFLQLLGVNIPSPYYMAQDNRLLVSESAETLLAAANAARRNDSLLKTELWRALSEDNAGPASFCLFYSLDRSLPFFLKGSSAATAALKLYRQGLARVYLKDRALNVSLSALPGAGEGLIPVAGYPLDLGTPDGGRAGNRLYQVFSGSSARLLLTRGGDALALNPLDRSVKAIPAAASAGETVYGIPAAEGQVPDAAGAAVWAANSQGRAILANRDMEPLRGFPLATGIKLSAPPAAWGGRLFLCDEDGSVFTVDSRASVSRWGKAFPAALRSPPSFLNYKNAAYAACYPKSVIAGEIYLLDAEGRPLPNWPVPVSGIAFGSPLLFSAQNRLLSAFIVQAGELAVYAENAQPLPGFPVRLEGVFYLQPVFDGESLWLIESGGTLYRVELDGEVFSQKVPRLLAKEGSCIVSADIDGDKKAEIFISGEGNALYGYSRNFHSLDGFPLPVWGRPVIGDIDGDRKIEIAGIGMDNRLYQWQFR